MNNFASIYKTVFAPMLTRLTELDKAKDLVQKLIERDINSRKTLEPDIGADGLKTDVGTTVEDLARLKEYKPFYDYEQSPENPFLQLQGNRLATDLSTNLDVVITDYTIKATVISDKTIPSLSTPALDQKMNNMLADYVMEGIDKVDIDRY